MSKQPTELLMHRISSTIVPIHVTNLATVSVILTKDFSSKIRVLSNPNEVFSETMRHNAMELSMLENAVQTSSNDLNY